MSEPDLLTVEEVSQKLRVSLRTVYNLIDRGELRAIRVGRLFRIPKAALEQFLKKAEERGIEKEVDGQ